MNRSLQVICLVVTLALACMAQPATHGAANASYSVRGRVVDAVDGHPIPNAEIYFSVSGKETGQQALLSGSDGAFRATGLPSGKYRVTAERKGYVIQSYGNHEGYFIGIAVGPGITEPEVTLKLQAEGAIVGIVRDQDETLVPDAEISLFRRELVDGLLQTYAAATQTTSDQGGRYRFSHLSPGQYFLVVRAKTEFNGYLESAVYATQYGMELSEPEGEELSQSPLPPEFDVAYPVTFYPNATTPAEAQILTVSAGGRLHADFRLQALPAVHVTAPQDISFAFRVKSFTGDELPVEAACVSFKPAGWRTLALAPGSYDVFMGIERQEGGIYSNSQMDLAGDVTFDHEQLVDTTSHVSGIAVMDDGSPLSSHMIISLTPLNSISIQKMLVLNTEEDGKIEWSGVIPPGKYTLALEESPLFIKSVAIEGAKIRGGMLDVRGAGPIHLSLVLTAGSSLVHGKVLNKGKATAGALVLLVPEDFENNRRSFRRDESDSDGTFGFGAAPAGNYIAVAIQNGWELEWAKPEVLKPYLAKGKPLKLASGATEDITLDLQ
jgi:hypothetical protein